MSTSCSKAWELAWFPMLKLLRDPSQTLALLVPMCVRTIEKSAAADSFNTRSCAAALAGSGVQGMETVYEVL